MAKLTAEQVGSFAFKAGVSNARSLATAIAIADLESGFNAGALADDSDDLSYGLWQINMKGSMGPDRRAKYGLASNEALYDPATNARVMAGISKNGTDYGPWSTAVPARVLALKYTATAGKVIEAGGGDAGIAGDIAGAVDGASAVANVAADASQALRATHAWFSDRNNWIRVAYVATGGAILIGALVALVRPAVDNIAAPVVRKVVGK